MYRKNIDKNAEYDYNIKTKMIIVFILGRVEHGDLQDHTANKYFIFSGVKC